MMQFKEISSYKTFSVEVDIKNYISLQINFDKKLIPIGENSFMVELDDPTVVNILRKCFDTLYETAIIDNSAEYLQFTKEKR